MTRLKAASAYYEIIIKTLVFITLIATAISFFGIFTTYLNLNYAARRVVREIEISGQVTSATYGLFDDMKTNTNIPDTATMSVSASYFNAAQKKIQLRDQLPFLKRPHPPVPVFVLFLPLSELFPYPQKPFLLTFDFQHAVFLHPALQLFLQLLPHYILL